MVVVFAATGAQSHVHSR
jgi:hypothetical protein